MFGCSNRFDTRYNKESRGDRIIPFWTKTGLVQFLEDPPRRIRRREDFRSVRKTCESYVYIVKDPELISEKFPFLVQY